MTQRIAVLMGGLSAEREVSLVSGAAIAEALREEGFIVTEIDANQNLWEQLKDANPDVIVNALHGEWGEDGKVQGILEHFGKPYTHSGVMASALAMDKHRAKAVLRDADINVPKGILIKRSELKLAHPMQPPYVVKPNGQGSSVGVYIVEDGDRPPTDIQTNDAMGDTVIVEQYIPGRELTVAVMDGRALAVTEIVPKTEWYDYEAKYADGGSDHILPAKVSDEVTELCKRWAVKAHHALGCSGVSRADFRFNDMNPKLTNIVNKIVMLEVNTQPGMTPTSLVPEQAAYVGMNFQQLCRWMVEDATWPRMEALKE